MRLNVLWQRAWRGLWIEGLVFGRTLGVLENRLVGLVSLRVAMLLWLLETLALVLFGAVLISYPALGRMACFGAKWGPIVLFLVWLRSKLLRVL